MRWLLRLVARNARKVTVSLHVVTWIDDTNNVRVRLFTHRDPATELFNDLSYADRIASHAVYVLPLARLLNADHADLEDSRS